ncbi:hypothetical protein TNCV_2217851 [Trichonephila clavipes]|nr:hypothetical protein TNCV_2217851 [Trichonephila clavipes]
MLAWNFKKYVLAEDNLIASYEWQHDEGSQAKQSEIRFIVVLCKHVGMYSVDHKPPCGRKRGGLTVMTGISIDGRTGLNFIRKGNLKVQRYAEEIFRLPYTAANGDPFLLIQDNSRSHTARLAENFLEYETIQRMEWSARSLDLNMFGHVLEHPQMMC